MQTKVLLTAILKDPEGVWQDEAVLEAPDDAPPVGIIMQVLATLRNNGGLLTFTDGGRSAEMIPMNRVKNITAKVEMSLAIGSPAAIEQAAARARQLQQQNNKLHVK